MLGAEAIPRELKRSRELTSGARAAKKPHCTLWALAGPIRLKIHRGAECAIAREAIRGKGMTRGAQNEHGAPNERV